MKCIQSIKSTKQIEVGEIRRVNDKEADSEVKSGYWKYIPKNEWKTATRKTKTVNELVKEKSPSKPDDTKEFKKSNRKK